MPLQTPAQIGAFIRTRRKQLKVTQQQLAEMAGVGRQWISEVEHGKPRAELDLLLRTFDALGLELTARDRGSDADNWSRHEPRHNTRTVLPPPDVIIEAARFQNRFQNRSRGKK